MIEDEDLDDALPNVIISQIMLGKYQMKLGLWCYLAASVTDVIWFYTISFVQFWLNASSFKMTAVMMVLFPGGSLMLELLVPKGILFQYVIMGASTMLFGDLLSKEIDMYI